MGGHLKVSHILNISVPTPKLGFANTCDNLYMCILLWNTITITILIAKDYIALMN